MRISPDRQTGIAWALTAVAIAIFVWLMSNVPLLAIPLASHDDGLFVRGAGYILAGAWLGPYDTVTLSKGPVYPLWIAASWVSGLPLLVSQGILYALCGLALVRALRPWLRSEIVAFAVFALILFNPVTYAGAELRVMREGLYTPLTLLLLALLIWWVRWRREALKRRILLAIGSGVLLGLYWCTRQEGVWILPTVALALAIPCAAVIASVGGSLGEKFHLTRTALMREGLVALALVIPAVGVVGSFALMNRAYYGIADVVDMKQQAFLDAYGGFVRIRAGTPPAPPVIVSRAQRERAYAVSPAAAELQPYLEGPALEAFVEQGCIAHRIDPCDGEYRAGWFVWAVRYAAQISGHYTSAVDAREYYRRLGNELEAACRDGRLSCLPPRRTLAPPFRWEFVPATARAAERALGFMATQDGIGVPRNPMSCIVDDCGQSLRWPLFLDLVHSSTLFVPVEVSELPRRSITNAAPGVTLQEYMQIVPGQRPLPFQLRAEVVARMLERVISLYRFAMPYFLGFALVAYVAAALLCLVRRKLDPLLGIATAAALVVLTRVLLLAYLDATSFPAINTLYLSPVYPAMLLFGVAAILSLGFAIKDRRAG